MKFINFQLLKRSFCHAFEGLKYNFSHEQNFKIQVIIGLIVFFLAFYFPLTIGQKITVVLLISLVLILELLNSVLERTLDLLKPRIDPAVEIIKKTMSGLVLLACLTSVIVGFLIFYPFFF
jgi:diacylglycerol kinase